MKCDFVAVHLATRLNRRLQIIKPFFSKTNFFEARIWHKIDFFQHWKKEESKLLAAAHGIERRFFLVSCEIRRKSILPNRETEMRSLWSRSQNELVNVPRYDRPVSRRHNFSSQTYYFLWSKYQIVGASVTWRKFSICQVTFSRCGSCHLGCDSYHIYRIYSVRFIILIQWSSLSCGRIISFLFLLRDLCEEY